MNEHIYRGSKQSTFPWEAFIAEQDIHASEVHFIVDDTNLPENPNILTIAVSEEFEANQFYETVWVIKEKPTIFFEFQNGHINRNRVLDQLRSANKSYIAPHMDSAYELIYLVKDFSSGVKYQVRGMSEPMPIPNPCRREYDANGLLPRDKLYMKFFFIQLKLIHDDLPSLFRDAPKVYGLYNLSNIVFHFVVSTFHIYTTENKLFPDTFYSNDTVRKLVLRKIEEIYQYYNSIGMYPHR